MIGFGARAPVLDIDARVAAQTDSSIAQRKSPETIANAKA
jgi:hypothetical protein